MLDEPWITETEAQQAAVIHLHIPRSEMMTTFGAAVSELMGILAEQGIKPDGPVFAHHLNMSSEYFDFELGVRVASPVEPVGRVKLGKLPSAKVARTVYQGPYEGLPAAWGEFTDWIRANGYEQAHDLWEVYSVGPHITSDATEWRTELSRPLKK